MDAIAQRGKQEGLDDLRDSGNHRAGKRRLWLLANDLLGSPGQGLAVGFVDDMAP